VAIVPANTVSQLLSIAQAQDWLADAIGSGTLGWSVYAALWLWLIAVVVRLAAGFGLSAPRNAAMTVLLTALFAVAAWQFPDRAWLADTSQLAEDTSHRLELTQETFEVQQGV